MTRTLARLLLGLAAGLLLMLLPSPAAAQTACGGPGQRGCCVASTERLSTGACSSGLVEVAGCTGNCACGGSGLAVFFGSSSSSTCQAVSACGGPGERACCITETRWDTNPIPASGGCQYDAAYSGVNGLTEVAGGSGAGILCGGSNPFGLRSNGTCQTCGTEGAHACVERAVGSTLPGGLTDVLGFCRTCGGEGQPLCALPTIDAPPASIRTADSAGGPGDRRTGLQLHARTAGVAHARPDSASARICRPAPAHVREPRVRRPDGMG